LSGVWVVIQFAAIPEKIRLHSFANAVWERAHRFVKRMALDDAGIGKSDRPARRRWNAVVADAGDVRSSRFGSINLLKALSGIG
jgi:hypothetical protein